MANRQRGCTAEVTQFRSRRNAESTEVRGLKRQTGGADGRRNAVAQQKKRAGNRNTQGGALRPLARSSFASTTRRTCASSIYNIPRTSTFSDRRRIFPSLPTPFAAIPRLIVRTSPHGRARTHPLARHFYSLRTIFPAVIPRSCSFCAQLRHAVYSSTRKVNGQTSKPVNERSTRSNHLTRLLVYESTCLQGK